MCRDVFILFIISFSNLFNVSRELLWKAEVDSFDLQMRDVIAKKQTTIERHEAELKDLQQQLADVKASHVHERDEMQRELEALREKLCESEKAVKSKEEALQELRTRNSHLESAFDRCAGVAVSFRCE